MRKLQDNLPEVILSHNPSKEVLEEAYIYIYIFPKPENLDSFPNNNWCMLVGSME